MTRVPDPLPARLPGGNQASVKADKLKLYLLDPASGDGGSKAAWFGRLGFHQGNREDLRAIFREAAVTGEVIDCVESDVGHLNWSVRSEIVGPKGSGTAVTVWTTRFPGARPSFTTARPMRRGK